MIDRKHIEQFLHLNGLSPDSPDEEIRSLLISARWHHDDVETALVVLREDPNSHKKRIDTVHQVFRSDYKLNPETLSSLLGMEVKVDSVIEDHQRELNYRYRKQIFSIIVISVVSALLFLIGVMWFMEMGIFHEYAFELPS